MKVEYHHRPGTVQVMVRFDRRVLVLALGHPNRPSAWIGTHNIPIKNWRWSHLVRVL